MAVLAWKRFNRAGPEPTQPLAVLPLQNLSGDPAQEYFADGMTEALITDLAKIPGLKVISRTSIMQFKDSHQRLPEIARELGVDGIVEGSVLRSGDHVRITAQLVRGATDQHIWAESYERDLRDLVALQDEVSRSIAAQVQKEIAAPSAQRLATSAAVTPQAREDYLKGRYFWNLRSEAGYLKAIDYFQAAVTENPQYAQAYAGLADAYGLLGSLPTSKVPRDVAMPKAKEMALTALKLDDTLADAHTSLAFVEMHYEWKFREAEQEFKRAIDLNPNYSIAHHWYAYDLAAVQKIGAKRLVIDSLAGFEMALAPGFRADFRESLYRMITALTGVGVTILSTVEVNESFTEFPFSTYSISFLTDDIIRLRYVCIDGQLRKIMVVIKMRGGNHSKDIREYEITSKGVVIMGDRLTDYQGLITGIPVHLNRSGNNNNEERSHKPKAKTKT